MYLVLNIVRSNKYDFACKSEVIFDYETGKVVDSYLFSSEEEVIVEAWLSQDINYTKRVAASLDPDPEMGLSFGCYETYAHDKPSLSEYSGQWR